MHMTETTTSQRDQRPSPLEVIDGLVGSVPKLIERTRQQAAFARTLAGMAPCLGFLAPRMAEAPAGSPRPEAVDVLTVLNEDLPDLTLVHDETSAAPDTTDTTADTAVTTGAAPDTQVDTSDTAIAPDTTGAPDATPRPTPSEDDLPVQDYDSLAASQVVPRLATLDAAELLAVQAYESAHRNRQTILNRVAQLLAG